MRSWLFPAARRTEATLDQVVATGAAGGAWGTDPVDDERGWQVAGSGRREVPWWTQEKARIYSVAGYRANPMARAIIDTYTSFCVGDRGLTYHVGNDEVGEVVAEFWEDPRNRLADLQEAMLRDHLLLGETTLEMLEGKVSGTVRYSPIAPEMVAGVTLLDGNPLWPDKVVVRRGAGEDEEALRVVGVDDATGLRTGRVQFWASFKALLTDRRGMPFLAPVLDWLDGYDTILSNLIDRTALARYLVWDVTIDGDQPAVDKYVKDRGGRHIPPSGSVEVHNKAVSWEPKTAQTGAEEDSAAARSVLTLVAAGTGLAKTWLAEPEDSNRATSLTMAEPVRRRVRGVQKLWTGYITELSRFAIDRAVAAKRIPGQVAATDAKSGATSKIPAAQAVTVTGPEIAAADAEITAKTLLNLATGLSELVEAGILTREAAAVAARKAWEDYAGIPYTAALEQPDKKDDLAEQIDNAPVTPLRRVLTGTNDT